ncbi:MAG: hypothetical protein HY809_06970 [Nitrospirae bacterium]|nr:hypothetical protein [Nitrospirota bacterium]
MNFSLSISAAAQMPVYSLPIGKWEERDKSSAEIVKDMRKEDKRRYANRNR